MLDNLSAAFIDVTKQQLAWSIVDIEDSLGYRAREAASGIAVCEFDLKHAKERLESVVGAIHLFRPHCLIGINACWGVATYWVQNFCTRREKCTSVFVSDRDVEQKLPTKEKPYYRLAMRDVNNIANHFQLSGDLNKIALALAYLSRVDEPAQTAEPVSEDVSANFGSLLSPTLIAEKLIENPTQQRFNSDFAKATATVVIHELLQIPGLIDREALARAFG